MAKKKSQNPPASDGYYHKYLTYNGKRYHIAKKTEQELYIAVGQLLQQLADGTRCLNKNTTVRRWSEEWIATYKEGNITEKSLRTYTEKLNGYILPAVGDMKLQDVTEVHLQKILNSQRGMSFSHVSKLRMIMTQMFGRAVSCRIITFNPAANLILPDCQKGTRRSLTDRERSAVLAVCERHNGGFWVKMILYCGLRPGETAALQWRDIDFQRGIVHVRAARESGSTAVKEPKTEAGIRDVPIRPDYLAELRAVRGGPFEYVFTQAQDRNRHKPHTESSMNSMWKSFRRLVDIELAETALRTIATETSAEKRRLLAGQLEADLPVAEIIRRVEAGNLSATYRNQVVIHGERLELLEELKPYCLRHTYCTDLQRAGVSLNVAKYLMGHSDISVTANIYTHTTEDVVQDAAERINAFAGVSPCADFVQRNAKKSG